MSTEKIIKNQTKDLLKGNWSNVIAAILAVIAVILSISMILSAFLYYVKAIDPETGAIVETKQTVILAASMVASAAIIFVSPIINGFFKMLCNISLFGKAEIYDLFYFFRGAARYFKTVFINFVLYYLFSIISSFLNVYGFAALLTDSDLSTGFRFDAKTFALLGAYIVSVVINALVYILFVHYPLIAYSYNDSLKASKYMFGFIGFSFRHFAKTLKLAVSFLGWLVLSGVFVVPAFYAVPYIAESGVVSAKWLFMLEKNRGVL